MAADKPTAVHFSLIFFVMLSIILGVVAWISRSDYNDKAAEAATQADTVRTLTDANRRQLAALNRIKELLGFSEFEEWGVDDEQNEQTTIGAMQKLIQENGTDVSQGDPSWSSQIRRLRTQLETQRQATLSLQAELNRKDAQLQALNRQKQETIDKFRAQVAKAEEDLRKTHQVTDESLQRKTQQIDQLTTEKENLQTELAQLRTELKEATDSYVDRLALLTVQNNRLMLQRDDLIDESFERADGEIRFVDYGRKLAWISLGSADDLPVRTSFSVYTRDNQGVARRNKGDIKGKIEVTRIVDSHLAEARIIDQDVARPIAKGDPIYTPLFTVGVREKFSFVGGVDLDGDGRSDRELLRTIVTSHSAEIDNEVDDEGNLIGDGLSVETTFLVIGEIPDERASGDVRQDRFNQLIREHDAELRQQARELGIRWIALKDFLDYIGFKPRRRLYRPGEGRPFNLKAGRPPVPSGTVSGAYSGRRRPAASNSPTSGIYGGR